MPSVLRDKQIILGVTGSIAAFKAVALASLLAQSGARVDVIMTESAQRFVTPLSFQAVTGRPVYTDIWQPGSADGPGAHISHVGLAHHADLILIAPITANTIARIALGVADDLLSVTMLAARCPVLIAPAMDSGMYENPATQAHIRTLRERGVHIAGPVMGRMASGLEGLGRMLEPEAIAGHSRAVLGRHGGDLAGRQIVVSAGPTREMLDPVRYLTNRSSGKQGYAICQAALDAGADVTLISGPVDLPTPAGATRIDVMSAHDMLEAVLRHAATTEPADALIMAAAVADFRPRDLAAQKIKKIPDNADSNVFVELVSNPDILYEVAQQKHRPRITVGFAAESNDLIENAQSKLARKRLDLIVANDITAIDAGFEVDTNRVHFISGTGSEALPLLGKDEVAARIIAWVAEQLNQQDS